MSLLRLKCVQHRIYIRPTESEARRRFDGVAEGVSVVEHRAQASFLALVPFDHVRLESATAGDDLAERDRVATTDRVDQVLAEFSDGCLQVSISDNGPGFTKEEREKAFEAFFTTKKQGFGSGLGLYISYYLLSQVGGRIAIEEPSGPGARMRVTLSKLDGLDDQDPTGS